MHFNHVKAGINFICIILVFGFFFPFCLLAQESSDIRIHEKFFLRFLAGMGSGNIVFNYPESDMVFSAASGLFHFQIGSEIAENLVLFGDFGGFSLTEPTVEWQGLSSSAENADISSFGIGAGLSYYFMPADIYLSGSFLLSQVILESDDIEAEGKMGPGVFICIGKEWWVGKKWGLGIAGFFENAWTKDQSDNQGYQAPIKSCTFGIAFSATLY
jgi:hypothetical protein